MALLTSDGAGPAPLLAGFQVATLALPVKGVFQVQQARLGLDLMALLTVGHRLPLAPDVAAPDIVMVTGSASDSSAFVGLMAKQYRPLLPGLKTAAIQ